MHPWLFALPPALPAGQCLHGLEAGPRGPLTFVYTSIITLENKVGKFCILLLGIYPGEILANVCNKVHSSNA